MIVSVRANDPRFQTVRFSPGFNILVADTTADSTTKDTRNGLGKTLLMEVVHFCLGASAPTDGEGLGHSALAGWQFTLELVLAGKTVEVTRAISEPQRVRVAGDFDAWPITPTWDKETSSYKLALGDWKTNLGTLMFGLRNDTAEEHSPTFRGTFPYFARVHSGAYVSPFKFFANQPEVAKQVAVAFLLGLAWEDASRFQVLKDQRKALASLKAAIKKGALGEQASLGELRAQRVQAASRVARLEAQLETFEVHPEYGEITRRANELTEEIHGLVNAGVVRARTVAAYHEQGDQEKGPDAGELVTLFEAAGVELGTSVVKTLQDAQVFHDQVIANRRAYLSDEIARLAHEDTEADAQIAVLSKQRARLMDVLESKHALEELNLIQGRLAEARAALATAESQISRVNEIEERESAIGIEFEQLRVSSRREHAEREPVWSRAIELFAAATEQLYGSAGELLIDLPDTGFKFDVRIRGGGSRGVDSMKVFAFDIVTAQLWSTAPERPGLLWHDSELFDGVDERQIALAFRLAATSADEHGFQYFCSINTDDLPPTELLDGLAINPVITLTDATDDGGLFGMRF